MHPRHRAIALSVGAAALLALSSPASAQTDALDESKRAARQLANQGKERYDAGDYKKALELFRQAEARFHAPPLVLMQANSHAKLGALLEARALYEQVAREDLGPNPPPRFRSAREEALRELESLKKRIPALEIVLERASSAVRIQIDGAEVPAARTSQPIELNPGPHTITFLDSGRERAVSVTLKEGARERVNMTLSAEQVPSKERPRAPGDAAPFTLPDGSEVAPRTLPPTPWMTPIPTPGAPAAPASAAPGSTSAAASGVPVLPIVAFGIGGASFLTCVVTGAIYLSKNSDILPQCKDGLCPPPLADDIDTAKLVGRIALATLIVGGAGIAAGTAMLIIGAPQKGASAAGSTLVVVGPGSAAIRGTF